MLASQKKLIFMLTVFLLFLNLRIDAKDVRIDAETPYFAEPDISSKVLAIQHQTEYRQILAQKRVYIKSQEAYDNQSWHPVMIYTDFYQVKLPDGRTAWISEEILYHSEKQIAVPRSLPTPEYNIFAFILCMLFILILYLLYKNGNLKKLLLEDSLLSNKSLILIICGLLLFQCSIFLFNLSQAANMMVYPTDETNYFNIAKDILDWNFSANWLYPIGLPLIYIPLILATNASDFYDMVQCFTAFNAFIVAPIVLILIFIIIQKVTNSSRTAFFTLILLILIPFFYFPYESHVINAAEKGLFTSIFTIPQHFPGSYRIYYIFFWKGFNAMSDMISTALGLLCILLVLSLKPDRKNIVFISALFSFCCLIRLANIFLSPLIAYLFFCEMRKAKIQLKEYVICCSLAIFTFIVVLIPQFLANLNTFGSLFRFPSGGSIGFRAEEGFALDTFSAGTDFLISTNYIFMVMGATGILFLEKKHLKRIFGFWALPLIIFYSGYPVVGASPIRFILTTYGALVGSFICCGIWRKIDRSRFAVLTILILLNFILISPTCRFSQPYPFDMHLFHWGKSVTISLNIIFPIVSLVSVLWMFSKQKDVMLFCFVLFGLYYSGSSHLIMAVFIALLLWSVITFIIDVKKELFTEDAQTTPVL